MSLGDTGHTGKSVSLFYNSREILDLEFLIVAINEWCPFSGRLRRETLERVWIESLNTSFLFVHEFIQPPFLFSCLLSTFLSNQLPNTYQLPSNLLRFQLIWELYFPEWSINLKCLSWLLSLSVWISLKQLLDR